MQILKEPDMQSWDMQHLFMCVQMRTEGKEADHFLPLLHMLQHWFSEFRIAHFFHFFFEDKWVH